MEENPQPSALWLPLGVLEFRASGGYADETAEVIKKPWDSQNSAKAWTTIMDCQMNQTGRLSRETDGLDASSTRWGLI